MTTTWHDAWRQLQPHLKPAMTDRQWTAINLHWAGWGYTRIAAHMGVSRETARGHVHRAQAISADVATRILGDWKDIGT